MKQGFGYLLAGMVLWTAGTASAQTSANHAVALNGTTDYIVCSELPANVADNFTLELWVQPEMPHQIDAESQTGFAPGVQGQHYAVYPVHGTALWGSGHAGVGVSVGTNGVSVYEHAADHMPAVLVYAAPISGWTHVAVVYRNRTPSLYINGELVRTGTRSTMTVHPSAGRTAGRHTYGGIGGGPWGYFRGTIDDFRIWDRSRTEGELKGSMPMNGMVSGRGLVVAYDMNRTGEGRGLSVQANGLLSLTGTTNGTNATPRFVPVASSAAQDSGFRLE